MNRQSLAFSLALFLLAFCQTHAMAADASESGQSNSTWVTSIARVGESGDRFVAATADGLLLREAAVMSFDAANPNELTQLYTHPAAVWRVVATADGSRVASVDYRGNLVVYDVAAGQPKLHEKALERWCQALIVANDGKSIVAGNEAGKVLVWDLQAGKVTQSAELDGHAVTSLASSPDGSLLAATDGAGHVHLLKWPSLEPAGTIEVSKETLWCVTFVNEGKDLLVGSSDRNLYRCPATADAKPEVVAKGTDWITQLAVSPGGQVAAAEVGGKLHFPSLGGSDSMDAKSGVWSLCWNGDAQLFAGTRKDGIVIAGRSWKWTEAKPVVKPAEETPADKAAEAKPAEAKPAAEKPAAEKPAADKPAADKPAEAKPAEAKPAAEKSAADKPAADESAASENKKDE